VKQKKQKRRRSKSERRQLEEKLWNLTADFVKARDGCCVTCGATEGLTISHWIPAGKQRIRYDLRNCNCQCSTCNGAHNHWHYYYDNYMLKTYGESVMVELTELAMPKKWKWSVIDLRALVAEREC